MPVSPETLLRHELNGLHVAVVDAPNPDLVGIAGRVVSETTRTLHVESGAQCVHRKSGDDAARDESRVKVVPKDGTRFQFALTDEAAGREKRPGTASKLQWDTAGAAADSAGVAGQSGCCEDVAYVTVDGSRLLSRPARRTETGGVSTWR